MKINQTKKLKSYLLPFLMLLVLSTSFLFLMAIHQAVADGNNNDDGNNHDNSTATSEPHDGGDDDNNNHDEDEHNDGDSEAHHEEREVKVSNSGKEVEIESELKNGTNKDKVELEIHAKDEIEVKLKYKSSTKDTEYKVEFRVEFKGIIEYIENGTADSGYQPESDTIVTKYRLKDHLGSDINYTVQTINGAQVHVFEVTTTDGVLKAIFKLPEAVLNVSNNVVLTPSALKIDVEITNFPYQGSGTSLALLTKVKTKTKYELKDHTELEDLGLSENETELELSAPDNSTSGFFSWAETAIADGQTIQVVNTQPLPDTGEDGDEDHEEGEESRVIYFSFIAVQPSHIYWDPKVGVLTAPYLSNLAAAANGVSTFSFEFLVALAAIGVVSAFGLRRKWYQRKR